MSEEKKGKTTPASRVEQYFTDLTLKNGSLWCPWCLIALDSARKASIDYHVESKNHKKNKAGGDQQRRLTEIIPLQTDISKAFIVMFLCAGIPLYKVQIVEEFFLNKHMPTLKLPVESSLVKDVVPKLYDEALGYIKTNFATMPFALLMDETKDSKSRCVINTIACFTYTKDYVLLDTCFETHVDNFIIVKIANKIIEDFKMSWNNCIGIATDNVPYMTLAVKKLKELNNPKILHIRCISHICNLAIGQIADCTLCEYFKTLIITWTKFMKKVKGTQDLYSKFLQENGLNVKHLPVFAKTRWLSFWLGCLYLKEYINAMKEFIRENSAEFPDGKLYSDLKKLLVNELSNEKRLILEYLSEAGKDFVRILLLFEEESSINHVLNDQLHFLSAKFRIASRDKYFGAEFEKFANENHIDVAEIASILQEANKLAEKKLEEYKDIHELKKFLGACEMMDSLKMQSVPLSFENFMDGIITEANVNAMDLKNEYKLYEEHSKLIKEKITDIMSYWNSLNAYLPNLSKIAKNSLSFTVSTCNVERSFAMYRYIYSERRKSFKEAGLKMHLFYAFNKALIKKMYGIK